MRIAIRRMIILTKKLTRPLFCYEIFYIISSLQYFPGELFHSQYFTLESWLLKDKRNKMKFYSHFNWQDFLACDIFSLRREKQKSRLAMVECAYFTSWLSLLFNKAFSLERDGNELRETPLLRFTGYFSSSSYKNWAHVWLGRAFSWRLASLVTTLLNQLVIVLFLISHNFELKPL